MTNFLLHTASRIIILFCIICLSQFGCSGSGTSKQPARERKATSQQENISHASSGSHYAQARSHIDKGRDNEAIQRLLQATEDNDFDGWQTQTPKIEATDYFPHRELGIIYFQNHEYQKAIEELEYSIDSTPSAKAYYYLERAHVEQILKDDLDWKPPKVILEGSTRTELTNSFSKSLKGIASDDTLLKSIRINEQTFPLEPPEKIRIFNQEIPLQEGEHTIHVSATDLTGKQNKTSLTIATDHQGPLVEIHSVIIAEKGMSIAGIAKDTSGMISLVINGINWPVTGAIKAYNFKFALPLGTLNIVAQDRAGNITETTLSQENLIAVAEKEEKISEEKVSDNKDNSLSNTPARNEAPRILLEKPIHPENTFNDSITLNFRVIDTSGIHSIFMNKEPIIPRTGKIVFFSVGKPLKIGPNNFYVTAFDSQGMKTKHFFSITRNVPKVSELAHRMKIAVLPFKTDRPSDLTTNSLHRKIAEQLKKQHRFQVLNSRSFKDADILLTGSFNSSSGYGEIVTHFFDAHSKTLIETVDVFGKAESYPDQENLTSRLAEKISISFPVKKGTITKRTGNNVTINLGIKDGIKEYSKLLVYRESPPIMHPVTKSLFTPEPEIIGSLQVLSTQETSASAKIINKSQAIRINDRVIIK